MTLSRFALGICWLLLSGLLAGCGGSSPDPEYGNVLMGRSTLGEIAYLADASVSASGGGGTRSTTTDEQGNYSFRSLSKDTYTVAVSTVSSDGSWEVNVKDDVVFNPSLPLPVGFDRDYFRAIANVRPYVSDGGGGTVRWGWDLPVKRWRPNRSIAVYYDPNAATNCTNDWVTITREELSKWESILGVVSFVQVFDGSIAHLYVACVAEGSLGFGVLGYAPTFSGYDLKFYDVGDDIPRDSVYTELAGLQVVESASSSRNVIAHELAHVIGLGHVADSTSMLYPYSNSKGSLTAIEVEYAKTLYSIASGIVVPASGSVSQMQERRLTGSGGSALVVRASGAIDLEQGVSVPERLLRLRREK